MHCISYEQTQTNIAYPCWIVLVKNGFTIKQLINLIKFSLRFVYFPFCDKYADSKKQRTLFFLFFFLFFNLIQKVSWKCIQILCKMPLESIDSFNCCFGHTSFRIDDGIWISIWKSAMNWALSMLFQLYIRTKLLHLTAFHIV